MTHTHTHTPSLNDGGLWEDMDPVTLLDLRGKHGPRVLHHPIAPPYRQRFARPEKRRKEIIRKTDLLRARPPPHLKCGISSHQWQIAGMGILKGVQ